MKPRTVLDPLLQGKKSKCSYKCRRWCSGVDGKRTRRIYRTYLGFVLGFYTLVEVSSTALNKSTRRTNPRFPALCEHHADGDYWRANFT